MASYTIPATNSVKTVISSSGTSASHQVSVKPDGTATAGELIIKVKSPGGSIYETIPDGTIDLTDLKSILFTFVVAEYQFQVSNFSGDANLIHITDSLAEV